MGVQEDLQEAAAVAAVAASGQQCGRLERGWQGAQREQSGDTRVRGLSAQQPQSCAWP